jgi:hypothetical protein
MKLFHELGRVWEEILVPASIVSIGAKRLGTAHVYPVQPAPYSSGISTKCLSSQQLSNGLILYQPVHIDDPDGKRNTFFLEPIHQFNILLISIGI